MEESVIRLEESGVDERGLEVGVIHRVAILNCGLHFVDGIFEISIHEGWVRHFESRSGWVWSCASVEMVGVGSSSGSSMLTNGGGCIFDAIIWESILIASLEGWLGFWGVIVVIISMVLFIMAQSSLSGFFFTDSSFSFISLEYSFWGRELDSEFFCSLFYSNLSRYNSLNELFSNFLCNYWIFFFYFGILFWSRIITSIIFSKIRVIQILIFEETNRSWFRVISHFYLVIRLHLIYF